MSSLKQYCIFSGLFFRRSSVHEIAYDDNRAISPAPQTFVQPPPILPSSSRKRQEPRSPRKSPRRQSSPPTRVVAVSKRQYCCRSGIDRFHHSLPFFPNEFLVDAVYTTRAFSREGPGLRQKMRQSHRKTGRRWSCQLRCLARNASSAC